MRFLLRIQAEKNPNDRYCTINVDPKIRKVREQFAEKAK